MRRSVAQVTERNEVGKELTIFCYMSFLKYSVKERSHIQVSRTSVI